MNNSLSTVCFRNPYNVEPFNFIKKRVYDNTGKQKKTSPESNKKKISIGVSTQKLELVEKSLSDLSVQVNEIEYNVYSIGIATVNEDSVYNNADNMKYKMMYISMRIDSIKDGDINTHYVDSAATHLIYKTNLRVGAKPTIILFCAKPVKNPVDKMFWLIDINKDDYIEGILSNSVNNASLKKNLKKQTISYNDIINSISKNKCSKKDWCLFKLSDNLVNINELIQIS